MLALLLWRLCRPPTWRQTVNMLILVGSALYEKHAIVSVEQTPVGISCVQNSLSLPIILLFGALVAHETPLATLETTGVPPPPPPRSALPHPTPPPFRSPTEGGTRSVRLLRGQGRGVST